MESNTSPTKIDGMAAIRGSVPLAQYTTLGLGGNARYFTECTSVEELRSTLLHAKYEKLRVFVLGGGSNIIFPDKGYDGLVVRPTMHGMVVQDDGDDVLITVGAGEEWDAFVQYCVEKGFAGVECLSGIPGLVGATPIQNVGAYGQEVRETIVSLKSMDRFTLVHMEFSGEECRFGYRQSRFKSEDMNRYIITHVTFRLRRNAEPVIKYPELRKHIESSVNLATLEVGRSQLEAIRNAVIALRKKKSMVIDPSDPNSRSVGSFFMNPVISTEQFQQIQQHWTTDGNTSLVPSFPADGGIKIPAAWLVEQSGFARGYTKGGVGISSNHALALINRGGTATELLALAADIQSTVLERFGIRLEREPVVVAEGS
ncbi:MAG: UDP-N-acetylmuramate dehydrogenase [Bacteroidota bacterium]